MNGFIQIKEKNKEAEALTQQQQAEHQALAETSSSPPDLLSTDSTINVGYASHLASLFYLDNTWIWYHTLYKS